MINHLSNAGALPTLELLMRFAGERNRLLSHNIANIDTPNFQPMDVSPTEFQRQLSEAIDDRRGRTGGASGRLNLSATGEVTQLSGGRLRLRPRTATGNVLFHDRNNRDLERMMQDLVENASTFRVASDLLRSRVSLIRNAISERV